MISRLKKYKILTYAKTIHQMIGCGILASYDDEIAALLVEIENLARLP